MRNHFWLLCTAGIFVLAFGLAHAETTDYYVNGIIGNDENEGTIDGQWKTLTHALTQISTSQTSPATLHIGAGAYSPSGNGESFPLVMPSYLCLVGTGPNSTVLDAESSAKHVIFFQDATASTLQRMAITGGAASGSWPDGCGGGICSIDSTFTASECDISENSVTGLGADDGGAGVYIYGRSFPVLDDCVISVNTADASGGGILSRFYAAPTITNCQVSENTGGGIAAHRWSSIMVENCSIASNTGGGITISEYASASIKGSNVASNTGAVGAGVVCTDHSDATIDSCTLFSNESEGAGGAILCDGRSSCVIVNSQMSANTAQENGGGICCLNSELDVSNSDLAANEALLEGGGLYIGENGSAIIEDCTIAANTAVSGAALAVCESAGTELESCIIRQNQASGSGGALFCISDSSPMFSHCKIISNEANGQSAEGGAIYIQEYCYPEFFNCLIADNSSAGFGGAIFSTVYCDPVFENTTIWNNTAPTGSTLYCESHCWPEALNSIIQGGTESSIFTGESGFRASYCCIAPVFAGAHCVESTPIFTEGPLGLYYLSSLEAGQAANSPCVDAGSDLASDIGLSTKTTRTDDLFDGGAVDIGFHYPSSLPSILTGVNSASLKPGESLSVSITVKNPGTPFVADVYVALILPDGAIFCLGQSGGLGIGVFPWVPNITIPSDFVFGPQVVLQLKLPSSTSGTYYAASALCEPDTMDYIGLPSLVSFAIVE